MKDAGGHGSEAHGAHASGVDQIGRPSPSSPQFGKSPIANAREAARYINESGFPAEIYREAGSTVAAIYSNTDHKIYVNVSNRFWKDPVGSMVHNNATGHLSSDSPTHILDHEMAHAMYDAPNNFFGLEQGMARSQVSRYAAMNPKEFVSEVHAGMKAGKSYSLDVMRAFTRYAQPRGPS